MSKEMPDKKRCKHCGWPIVPEGESGCWESNCSMRPMLPIPTEVPKVSDSLIQRAFNAGKAIGYIDNSIKHCIDRAMIESDYMPRKKIFEKEFENIVQEAQLPSTEATLPQLPKSDVSGSDINVVSKPDTLNLKPCPICGRRHVR